MQTKLLLKTLKAARVASSRFLISTLEWHKNYKKILQGLQIKGHPKNQGFTVGLAVNKTPNLHIYANAHCLIISALA